MGQQKYGLHQVFAGFICGLHQDTANMDQWYHELHHVPFLHHTQTAVFNF
jgi:hypothetical protein